MSTQNFRITPIAFSPPASSPPPAPAVLRPLAGPIVINCNGTQHELRSGSLLIGRLAECDIMLEEELVSRMHARIFVGPDGVTIEDLHSTNGVFVNGDRIVQVASLNVGDRALIGAQELSFEEIRTDPAPPLSPSLSTPPPSGSGTFRAAEPLTPAQQAPNQAGAAAAIPVTARAEALDLLGTLARRLANENKAEQAPRMLGPHLRGILRGASSGLVVPEALATSASEYAIDLAHWTADASWLDYVIELHLVTRRLVPSSILAALQRAERWVGAMNRPMLEYYVASFSERSKQLDRDEKARLTVLRRILKKR
jgi:hypothetical protein